LCLLYLIVPNLMYQCSRIKSGASLRDGGGVGVQVMNVFLGFVNFF
jgi:hypothetical protein